MGRLILLLGGQKSGKSSTAARLATDQPGGVTVIAPADPADAELAERVARHRRDRPDDWTTVESFDLAASLEAADADHTVIVDALDTWLARRMEAAGLWTDADVAPLGRDGQDAADAIVGSVPALVAVARGRERAVVVVAGQPGLGPHALGAGARRYVDLHGRVCRALADRADRVELVVAGRRLPLPGPDAPVDAAGGPGPSGAGRGADDRGGDPGAGA